MYNYYELYMYLRVSAVTFQHSIHQNFSHSWTEFIYVRCQNYNRKPTKKSAEYQLLLPKSKKPKLDSASRIAFIFI